MTPDEHRAKAEKLLAQADELHELLAEAINKGEMPTGEAERQYPEVAMLAQLAQAHTLLSWSVAPTGDPSV